VLGRQHILPYFALYYTTHRCNARCEWCSRAKEVCAETIINESDLPRTREFLAQVRKLVPTLYVSGGEPLVMGDIEERLRIACELKFYPILLNTNATLLDRHWGVLELIDTLVVSLHTLNTKKLARTYKISESMADRALENIREAARRAKVMGTAKIMANCVLTAENIDEVPAILNFCLDQGIELAVVPAIVNQQPTILSASVEERITYVRVLDLLIKQKRKDSKSIQGSIGYLLHIRDLKPVACRPDGLLPVSPDGYVINACDADYINLWRIEGTTSIISMLRRKMDFKEPFRSCSSNCLKACYTQPAVLLKEPWRAVLEYLSR